MPTYSPEEQKLLYDEWKEVRETLRYFGNKRFAQLTVFITANGFMLNAIFKKDSTLPLFWAGIFGMCLAVVFYLHEKSSVLYFKRFADRGMEIEDQLGTLRLMHLRPTTDIGTKATFWLYRLLFVTWFALTTADIINLQPGGWDTEELKSIASEWLDMD